MAIYLHLFWGAVVYLAACQLARGMATSGEWIGKALIKHAEAMLAAQREALSQRSRRGEKP